MFDGEEVTQLVVLLTDGTEIYAVRGEKGPDGFVKMTKRVEKIKDTTLVGHVLLSFR
jgi:hypothetical protein